MRTKKTEREEAAYIAGRIDAQVLCNMYFYRTGISAPELHGGSDDEMAAHQSAVEAAAIKFAEAYGPLPDAQGGDAKAKEVMADRLHQILVANGLQIIPLRKQHKDRE